MAKDPIVFGPWTGGMTSSRAILKLAVNNNAETPELVFSSKQSSTGSLVNPKTVPAVSTKVSPEMTILTFVLEGNDLKPSTQYFYVPKIGGKEIEDKHGRFKTLPLEGSAASFRFACAGDADSGSNDEVFTHILTEDPLFFCHLGDLHYEDTNDTNLRAYRENYKKVFAQSRQAELYRNVPIVYMWDDHDFCGDASATNSQGRLAALLSYQQCVPHYIDNSSGDVPLFQAFTVGRVRFLVTDTRSERTPKNEPDTGQKTMLGQAQKDWLKSELKDAKKKHPLVVWINSVPWIAAQEDKKDLWSGYTTERDEIGGFIEKEQITNVCMLSADMHKLAIDDGSNNRPPTGRGGFPVFQAAPLDKGKFSRKLKGGPYSNGVAGDNHQYGIVTIEDDVGKGVTVTLQGKRKGEPVEDATPLTFKSPR